MNLPSHLPIEPPIHLLVQNMEPSVLPPVSDNWYMVTVRAKKRDLFLKYLEIAIQQNQLQDMILSVETPENSVYEDIVLVNLADFKVARGYIQKIDFFQRIAPRPLKPEEVSTILRAKL